MEGATTTVYMSLERHGQHLILDGSLALLAELFDTLRQPGSQSAPPVKSELERGLLPKARPLGADRQPRELGLLSRDFREHPTKVSPGV